jgi:hypothetical protein
MRAGLQRTLPLILVVTFLLVPSTATHIFKTFLCDPFEVETDPSVTRRYLHDDLALSCDSDEYQTTRLIAFFLIVVWPLGVPVMYAVLLWKARDAIVSGSSTPLSQAASFLWADYESFAFFWEPMEMCRKLALTGGVLIIGEEFESARVLMALLVSVTFLVLHLSIRPHRRCVQQQAFI